jgi:hypothetical protein
MPWMMTAQRAMETPKANDRFLKRRDMLPSQDERGVAHNRSDTVSAIGQIELNRSVTGRTETAGQLVSTRKSAGSRS